MNRDELYRHERANMYIRHAWGYYQYDQHIWDWLLYHLKLIWAEERKCR